MEFTEGKITKRKIPELKSELRHEMTEQLLRLSAEEIHAASEVIQQRLLELPLWTGARVIGCFMSMPREVQLKEFIQRCREAGKKICVPAFQSGEGCYGWAWLEPGRPVRQGRWGIDEPAEPQWVHVSELDMAIVPGVAFDRKGHRLGHGAGFLDRLLAGGSAFMAGVAFEIQILEAVPAEKHDVAVDAVITEKDRYPLRHNRA
ncbi:MAG: 5-formyltetrahydrofolate cyclo-ligase [Lentisphaerota bacterium]